MQRGDYDHTFDNYQGVFGVRSPEDDDYCVCIHCEEEIDEGDEYSTDNGYMCPACYHENHRHCAWYDYDVSTDQGGEEATFTGRAWHNRGQTITEWVCQEALDCNTFVYVEEDSHWYHSDLVTDDTHDGECRAISWMETNDWFTCEGNQQWYPPDQMAEIAGNPEIYYSQEWLEDAGYTKNELGTWELKAEETINVEEAA